MNRQMPVSDSFWPLLDAACDGSLTETQSQELATLLASDVAARKTFIDHVELWTRLRMLAAAERACSAGLAQVQATFPEAFPSASTARAPAFLSNSLHGTVGYFSSGWPVAYLVATVICGVGLLVGTLMHVSEPTQVAPQFTLPSPSGRGAGGEGSGSGNSSLPSVVGRITGMVDCQWEKEGLGIRDWGLENPKSKIQNPKSLVALGDKFALSSGLLEITYDTGAKVILQGPVTYEVESNGGFLSIGKLTGKLEKSDKRGTPNAEVSASNSSFILHPSSFVIRTPTATVTDLGTEFGVEVSERGSAKVCVLVGSVRVENHLRGSSQVASAGEAFEVDADATRRVETDTLQKQFARTMPKPAIQDSTLGSFRDDFAGKPSRHWINPQAAICSDNRVVFVDLAFLRTSGDFNYGTRDFVATVKMTNADKGVQSSAFFGLGDGTLGTFYKEPCADGIPSVYLMYPGPGWIGSIASVHATQTEARNNASRKGRDIPATEPQPAGTTITVELAWTVATDTAVFSIDTNNDGVYEHRFPATYPGLSSSGYVSRLFIGGANGVSFSDFHVTVGPHAQAPANPRWDDESAAEKKLGRVFAPASTDSTSRRSRKPFLFVGESS